MWFRNELSSLVEVSLYIKEIGSDGSVWNASCRDRFCAIVNTVLNLRVPQNEGNSTSYELLASEERRYSMELVSFSNTWKSESCRKKRSRRHARVVELSWNVMAHGDARKGKWRGNMPTADAHTSAASSRLNWHPRRFKWTRPFRWKTKSGFCACAITFQTCSSCILLLNAWSWALRDKLMDSVMDRKFPAFHWTRMFCTVFAAGWGALLACYW